MKPKVKAKPDTRIVADEEVTALAVAYGAITSQPAEAWDRMLTWLNGRLRAALDARPNGDRGDR